MAVGEAGARKRSPGRRKKGAKASTADLLLDATSSLMVERNSADVTFADIAEHSGLNAALIRYHFGSKAGLFMALLERDAGGTFGNLEALVSADMPADQKLRHHVFGVIKTYWRYPYMNRLVAALSLESDSEAARFIAERFTLTLADAQRRILEQGEREGLFRPIDPMMFYFSVIGSCDHLFNARHSLKFAFGVEDIDDDLRCRYSEHVAGILLESVMV
ncbi:TetR family transcriptional regulator [Novosphingobium mangrovi (ex Hu et al. 2023)]|uniref:TetR family transcriptional regulator n=1 Tax=Novosphingobium mangrovi (ex Hu et al. 2023) TaxID=2930094 RepID=A0ABT0A814_9SPHN|nr:TetR family transcriptional regulator [Novosphingobium mangrovi (ex Hu et al. 2023)]MCJ1959322.1 TetR family transcriptional regulator [Novosphingobium mangrovi (ex Hu et al. 2023)]